MPKVVPAKSPSCPRQAPAFRQEAHAPHSRAGWALTVGSLSKDANGDGREEGDTDDMAPIILNEALELLDLLLNSVPLVLLPLCFCVQIQLVLVPPDKNRNAGVTTRFPWQGMAQGPGLGFLSKYPCPSVTWVTCRANPQRVISGQPDPQYPQKLVANVEAVTHK